MLRAVDRVDRVSGNDLAGDQPVEQHADGRQMLLDRRFLEIFSQHFDVGRDMYRFDVVDAAEMVVLAPGKEPVGRVQVGDASVLGVVARFVRNCTLSGPGLERGANIAERAEADGRIGAGPDIVAGQRDVLPAERGDMG